MELDARNRAAGTVPDASTCVIGAGPAGLALGAALAAAGKSVVLLESGSREQDPAIQELNAGETAGDPYGDLRTVRFRGIGGTAAGWNTWHHEHAVGRYLPLDPIDFEAREGIPWSGWPFEADRLEPWYREAQQVCGLGPFDYTAAAWAPPGLPLLRLDGGPLRNAAYQYGPAQRFTRDLPATLRDSATALLAPGATVVELLRSPRGDRIIAARWETPSGGRGLARADCFVIAAGGIESARLLLLTLGERPWLGHGFMEHPVDASLWLRSSDPALLAPQSFYTHWQVAGGTPVLGRLEFAPEFLRAERLPNASIRIVAGRSRRRYQLLIHLEQSPHPENRVLLGSQRDRLGLPLARLQWRFQRDDLLHAGRVRALVAAELARAGAGEVISRDASSLDPKQHHHAGTTRMHLDPALGVVDENLRVHGMENLYVAGSSVFPTAGVANPTLTVVALALRLAAHLAGSPPDCFAAPGRSQ